MKRLLLLAGVFALASSVAFAAAYDKTEKNKLYTLRLRVPEAALAIPALKSEIMARWKRDSDSLKSDAKTDKDADPQFNPFMLDTQWRVTFEDPNVISLSANSFIDENGAHPNGAFDSIVWDKKASRAVPFENLFVPGQRKAAFTAIAASARKTWVATITKRSDGEAPVPGMVDDGIGADPNKLGHYALIYAKGDSHPNGIVLLYGAGEIWPNAAGDFRLVIPVSVFRAYLTPEWKARFG
jgi:hypothetical protein